MANKNKNKNLAAKPEEGNKQSEATGADQSVSPLSSEVTGVHEASYGEMMKRKPRKDYRAILEQKREERKNYARDFKAANPETTGDAETESGSGETE